MNTNSFSNSYKEAGVDVTAGYKAVELMKQHVARTMTSGVLSGIGGFGGLFELDMTGITKPVLVSGTDGVGTKLKIAFLMDKHDTVGIDCVAMCVNDIICCGAKPQFFLDYIAVGKNYPEKIAQIVSGVAEGCVQSGCALIGGETAEMPGFYPVDEYDLAGFSVGVVDKDKILDPSTQKAGDVMIAIKSSGVHSNGFSLVRKVFSVDEKTLSVHYDELGKTLGETLLTPTKIYVKAVMSLLDSVKVKAISHITGGGFYENIPRSLPSGLSVKIARSDVQVLPIFDVIAKTGNIPERDMFNTFNMGEGVLIPRQDTETIVDTALKMFAGKKDITVIDLCSGSGCIGIALERKLDCGRAVCVEKSEKAAEYLRENISLNGSGAEIVMGDVTDEKLVEDMPEADLIVCNPPYLTTEDMDALQREVTFEPAEALFGGEDGLDFYREIVRKWKKKLKSGGVMLFEIGIGQEDEVMRLMIQHGFKNVRCRKDLCGVYRCVSGIYEK